MVLKQMLLAGGVALCAATAAVPVVLLAVATVAVWVPARRASKVEPSDALRVG